MDPQAIIATGFTASSAWVGRKLLGPLFDEIAQDLRQRYADRRAQNTQRILESGARRLGTKLEEPGTLPPRLLGLLLDEGSWCDDEVMAEYWGGIIAASRTVDGRDDRGITWAKAISRLSRFQIRAHYLLYLEMRQAAIEAEPFDVGSVATCQQLLSVYVPKSSFAFALEVDETEIHAVLAHTVLGLAKEGLIDNTYYAYGPGSDIQSTGLIDVPEDGLLVAPSFAGMELYFWAHGYCNSTEYQFVDRQVEFQPGVEVTRFPSAASLPRMRAARAEEKAEAETSPEQLRSPDAETGEA